MIIDVLLFEQKYLVDDEKHFMRDLLCLGPPMRFRGRVG